MYSKIMQCVLIIVCMFQSTGFKHRPKKILVFVNPFGGKKRGLKIWKKEVAPLFDIAGIEYKAMVTQRANHIKDILLSAYLDEYHVSVYQ